MPPACDVRSDRRRGLSGRARARRHPVRERGALEVPRLVRPVLGTREGDHASGARKPRVRDSRARAGYYRYFGAAAGEPAEGLLQLRSRWLAPDRAELQLLGDRRLRRRLGRQEQWLRADLAAHASAACTLAYWHHPRFSSGEHGSDSTYQPILAGALRRECRSRPGRARPRLRALRPADAVRRSRSRARNPRVRRRLGGKSLRTFPTVRPMEPRRATSRASASSSSRCARRATAGASGRRSGRSRTRAPAPATEPPQTGDSPRLLPQTHLRLLSYRSQNDEPRERSST